MGLSFTVASGSSYYCTAVSCSAPLETLVLSYDDVLFDSVVRLKLLLADEVFDIVSRVLLVALVLHTLDLRDGATRYIRSDVLFDTLFTEAVLAGEGHEVYLGKLIVAYLARLS